MSEVTLEPPAQVGLHRGSLRTLGQSLDLNEPEITQSLSRTFRAPKKVHHILGTHCILCTYLSRSLRMVDVRLPGKVSSNSQGARLIDLIITMIGFGPVG